MKTKTLLFKPLIIAAFGILLLSAFKSFFVRYEVNDFLAASAIIVAAVAGEEPQPPGNAPAGLPITAIDVCEGSIDVLNGAAITSSTVKTGNSVSLDGWTTVSGKEGIVPESVYVTFTTKNGQTTYFRTRRTLRPDVAQHFGQPKTRNAGFTASTSLSNLDGDVTLGLAREANARLEVCKNLKITLYRGDTPESQAAPISAPTPTVTQYDPIEERLTDTKEVTDESCEGFIDIINGNWPDASANKISGVLQVIGWTTIRGKDGVVPDAVFISLENIQGRKIYVRTKSTPRDDVKLFFGQPKLPNAGFIANIDVAAMKGEYNLSFSRLYQNVLNSCDRQLFPVQFEK